ncbi:DUF3176 domain-containing protein [Aspergillus stella-maris]|uniref:DUF3176 domain-containing protein n=1 Tax=Aspergillus stella-maris TaxID=1810926 RepID=UPI003CCD70D3
MAAHPEYLHLPASRSGNDDSSTSPSPEGLDRRPAIISSREAAASFSVLVVVLKRYEGVPITAWPFGALTLNGLVAILSSITRASLLALVSASLSQEKWIRYVDHRNNRLIELELYDQASRSIWGSLRYLSQLRRLHLAAFAAVLTILALAFDTFAQQVISFEMGGTLIQPGRDPLQPHFPRADIYTGEQIHSSPVGMNVGLVMEAAWHAGLLTYNVTDLQPTCILGNCTWPIVSSLAVCGACANVSSDVIFTQDPAYPSWSYNFSLPSGATLVNRSPEAVNRLNAVAVSSSSPNLRYKPIQMDQDTGHLFLSHFEVISQSSNTEQFYPLTPDKVVAHECALWFCIQAYNITVANANLWQNTTGEWRQVDRRSITQDVIQGRRGPQTLLNFTKSPAEFNVPDGLTYAKYANDFFPLGIQQTRVGPTPSFANGLWASIGNMDDYIDNFARILTNAIRRSSLVSPIADVHYRGIRWRLETYTRVRWAWLAFPGAMLAGSCLLILVTVWRTERSTVGPWKDSSLALLCISLGDHLQEASRGHITSQKKLIGHSSW